jgi:hypothetical protein
MPSQTRKADQAVEAFSAPISLLEQARALARDKGMTRSGFYRYCLAKECGFSEEEAAALAQHRGVTLSILNARRIALNENHQSADVPKGPVGKAASTYPKTLSKRKKPKKI